MSNLSRYIIIGLLLSYYSCKSSPTNSSDTDVLIPANVGSTWTYEISDSYTNGTFQEIHTIKGTRTFDGKVFSILEMNGDNGAYIDTLFFRNTSEGLEFLSVEENEPYISLLLKYPAEDGEEYTYTGEDMTEWEVTVSKNSIEVPSGIYEVLTYSTKWYLNTANDEYVLFHRSFTPEIGMIQDIDASNYPYAPETSQKLISYKLE